MVALEDKSGGDYIYIYILLSEQGVCETFNIDRRQTSHYKLSSLTVELDSAFSYGIPPKTPASLNQIFHFLSAAIQLCQVHLGTFNILMDQETERQQTEWHCELFVPYIRAQTRNLRFRYLKKT